ncbi:MAG: response regulator [Chitinophagaceae bacterium]|nr:response regulator [Chitinophagaceae bacterium]
MVITILGCSKHISNRIAELINETNKGVSFHNCCTYAEAIDCLSEQKTDVVLLDFDFEGNKAFDLLKKIRENSAETVVMVLFNLASDFSIKQFRDSGADYLFDKYNDFEKIAPVINAINKRATNKIL